MKELDIIEINGVEVIDSRLVAERLEIQHKNLLESIRKHLLTIESKFGKVTFETRPSDIEGSSQNTVVSYLTEDQALFITTLSRNTEVVMNFKADLVIAYQRLRKLKEVVNSQSKIPTTFREALLLAAEQAGIIEEQNLQIEQAKPKVAFFNIAADATGKFTLQQFAAVLKLPYGRNTAFKKLRELGYLQENNVPYRRHIDSKLFEVNETYWTNPKNGITTLATQTFVTQKGMIHFSKILK